METPSGLAHPVASGLRDAIALTVSKVFQALLALVGLKILLKTTSEIDYGKYQAFLLASNALIAVAGWPTWSVLRLGADEWVERRALGRTFVLHALLLLATCGALLGPILEAREQLDGYIAVAGATTIILAYGFSAAAGMVIAALLKPSGKLLGFSTINLLGRVLWVAALSEYLLTGKTIDAGRAMVLCLTMTGLPQLVLAILLTLGLAWPPASPQPSDVSRAIRFGIPILGRQIGIVAFAYVNYVAINHAFGFVDAGRFQVASTLAEQSVVLVLVLEDVVGPILARAAASGQASTLPTYYRTIAPQIVLLGSAAFGAGLILAHPILAALSAKAPAATASTLQILLLATAVRLVLTLETPVFDAHLISKPPLVSFVLGFATNLGLDVLLVPRLGIEGAAWGTLGGWLVNAVIRSVYLGARFRVGALRLYFWLFPTAIAFAYARFLSGNLVADLVVALGLLPLVLAIGKLTRVLSPETMTALEGVKMPDSVRRGLARLYGARR